MDEAFIHKYKVLLAIFGQCELTMLLQKMGTDSYFIGNRHKEVVAWLN